MTKMLLPKVEFVTQGYESLMLLQELPVQRCSFLAIVGLMGGSEKESKKWMEMRGKKG